MLSMLKKILVLLLLGFNLSHGDSDTNNLESTEKVSQNRNAEDSIQKEMKKFGDILKKMESKYNIHTHDVEEEYEELEGNFSS